MKFNVIDQILCDFQKDVRELLLLRLFSFLNKKIKNVRFISLPISSIPQPRRSMQSRS